jgi:hypothetical protein
VETEAGEGYSRPGRGVIDRVSKALGSADAIDDSRLRLGVAVALSLAGLYFFRMAAVETIAAALAGGLVVLAAQYIGLHYVGLRVFSRMWPGAARALATALLFACVCPPGLPPVLLGALGAGAVLVEGAQRRLVPPLALGGVLLAWAIAWLWWARAGLPLLAPFSLRTLDEPIVLWTRFQLVIDPLRLYAGNVAGPVGATSLGLASLGVLVLGYRRRVSWLYVAGFYLPPLAALLATRRPITVYLLCGEALVLAAIVAADTGRLPQPPLWRLGAGVLAGAVSAVLLLLGMGGVGFGIGVLASAGLLSVVQLVGITGPQAVAPSHGPGRTAAQARPAAAAGGGSFSPVQLALLVLLPPVGLFLLWRNKSVADSEGITLVALGSLLWVAALAGSLTWLWLLRLPT